MAANRQRGPGATETFRDDWRQLRAVLSDRAHLKGLARDLVEAFEENDLLTYASAVAFQALFALVPLLLAGLAVLGFFDLTSVWHDDLAPRVHDRLSDAAFTVVDRTVTTILGSQQGFWLTFGVGLALWEVSGAIRAAMGALNRIYGVEEERPLWIRFPLSFAIAAGASVVLGFAVALLQVGPELWRLTGSGLLSEYVWPASRWLLTIVLLLATVAALLRYVPTERPAASWLGIAATLSVASWIGVSLVFGWYVRTFASYGSIYGGLSVLIVLMVYVYAAALAFLVAIQVDVLVRSVRDPLRPGCLGPGASVAPCCATGSSAPGSTSSPTRLPGSSAPSPAASTSSSCG